ncbi:uncharacterized protein LOC113861742 [Abrus precatorius]|uniref:Uncharacterized protein LOC113861742 n=1 Tax=Abrus precatorius TaxID=3816 RepID=A0A8B8L766_ABRPR|nr:uncharacterized protein LOC113861742 [Abrus precatorius]
MAHQSPSESHHQIPSQPLDLNSPHPSKDNINMEQEQEEGPFLSTRSHDDDRDKDVTQNPSASKTLFCNKEKVALKEPSHAMDVAEKTSVAEALGEDSGRERLKRHRVEVAGRVWIPEIWGQEELLKDWIDCTAFDAPLVPSTITMARAALVEECSRANAAGVRIENRDLDFNVHMDLSLNNNCTNVEIQNTHRFSDTKKST